MSGLSQNSQLEIRTETVEEEVQGETPATYNPEDLPEYLRPREAPEKAPSKNILGVVAVIFFLIAAIGPAATTYFYLTPRLEEAQFARGTKEKALDQLQTDLEKEEKRGLDHVVKLREITETVTGPSQKPVREALNGLHELAAEVTSKRLNEGAFVLFSNMALTDANVLTVAGQVDSYLTLADWLEALQSSELYADVKFTGASQGGEGAEASVPFSLSFTFVPPKPEPKDPKKPAPTDSADPAEPDTTTTAPTES